MKFLKEIAHVFRYWMKTPRKEKVVIFYAEHRDYYPNFDGIIEELKKKYNQIFCYITSDPGDPILQKSDPLVKAFYIKSFLPIFMIFVKCKVFIMTLTDLNQFLLKRSTNPVHYVYVCHSMISTHMGYLYEAFDYYDSFLCVGQYQIEEICKHETEQKLPPKQLIKAGYYRLEQIYNAYQQYKEEHPVIKEKSTLLIAPSWGEKNVLESCGEQLVELLLEKGYEVIVRPHPETIRRFPKLVDKFAEKFGKNSDFILEKSVATFDSLLKADILICDMSGVVIEYALGTERPVLFLDVPHKVRNKNYKELGIEPFELSIQKKVGIIVSPDKLDSIPDEIEKLKRDKIKYREQIIQLREENVFEFGNSSKIGAEHILNLLNKLNEN